MNKSELILAMSEKTGLTKKDSDAAIKAFFEIIAEELKKGEKVQLVGIGIHKVTHPLMSLEHIYYSALMDKIRLQINI